MILFFLFGKTLVSIVILVTMIPSIQKHVYYPFVALIFHYKPDYKMTVSDDTSGHPSHPS